MKNKQRIKREATTTILITTLMKIIMTQVTVMAMRASNRPAMNQSQVSDHAVIDFDFD